MTKQFDIGFDQAVISCAAYLLRSQGERIRDEIHEMVRAYEPDAHRGTVGDLGILRQYGILQDSGKHTVTKGSRPVHIQVGDYAGSYKTSLCGRFLTKSTPTTTEASGATCKHCLRKLAQEKKP